MKKIVSWFVLASVIILIFLFLFLGKEEKNVENHSSLIGDIPVTVIEVKKVTLSSDFSLVGVINPFNDIIVVSQSHGIILQDYTTVGKRVVANEVIAKIDDILLQSNLAKEEINYLKSKRDFERNQLQYEQNSISAAQLDLSRLDMKSAENQLTIAKKELEDTKIKTPISGIINYDYIDVGTMVNEGTQIANVVDVSKLKVIVNISEKEVFQLNVGEEVEIQTDIYPGIIFKGIIANIASKADEGHTYRVSIHMDNSTENPLKGGMFARVYFNSIKSSDILAIPRESLIGSVKDAKCYVIVNGVAYLKKIVIGKESSQMLEVIDGLNEGDLVVNSGQNNLSDSVKVTISK